MWPLIRKELRDCLWLCAAALAVHGLLVGLMIYARSATASFAPRSVFLSGFWRLWVAHFNHPPLVDETLLGMLAIMGGIYAALLGLWQFLSESLRGTFPFLMHRPMSRFRILVGKCAAGFVLYAVGMCLPFACLALWASRPGAYAGPFELEMVYPGLVTIGFGFLFYLGAIGAALWEGRWYATRPACLVAPLAVAPVAFDGALPVAVATALIAAVLLFWADVVIFYERSF